MRTLLITVTLLAFGSVASACDVCGCSIGGNYFGILPQFHRHFVGLRYSEQSFRSAHSRTAAQLGNFDSEEHFRTVDVLGRFYPTRRFQMLVLAVQISCYLLRIQYAEVLGGSPGDVLGRLNTTNRQDYHYGNRVSDSANQQPVFQDLGGDRIQAKTRIMTTLNYIF